VGTDESFVENLQRAASVRADIDDERNRQDAMFGEQNHHPAYWLALLGKQMGQLGAKVVDREWAADRDLADVNMREEAVQLAAVAVAMIECIDRGAMPATLVTAQPVDPRQRMRALGRDDESIHYDPAMGREVADVQLPTGPGEVRVNITSGSEHIATGGTHGEPGCLS
jgi:hypothetical protein